MHIPDRYLSPETYVATYAAMAPIWALASNRVKKTLKSRQVPLLALCAAFSFVIMMFNVPIPGGSTGHAVGAVLIALLLGPWAACIAVSVVLAVQALIFGDGGITALAANCFNMAVVMPLAGYWVYRLISRRSDASSKIRPLAAAIAGYVGLNAAAITTAVFFGVQPLVAHDALGRPLYAPYPLKIAVPVMALEHLLVFGFVEAAVTGMVVAYLQRVDVSLLAVHAHSDMVKGSLRRLWMGLAALILLSPLGLILPVKFGASSAWGEWSSEEMEKLLGFLPKAFKLPESWSAPMPDYALKGQENAGMAALSASYILSAILGIAVAAAIAWGLGTLWQSRKHKSFWRRTISSLGKTLNSEFLTSESAAKDGFLQKLDPRTKIVSAVILVVAVTLVGNICLLAASITLAFTLAAMSKLSIRSFCAALTPVVILTTVLAVPSTLSAVTPGTAVFSWWKLAVTDNGLLVASRFLIGSTAAAAWMTLLVLSTPWPTLLWAIRSLRVPKVFVLILLMTYRYLFILVRHAEEAHLAKESRTITRDCSSSARQWVAGRAGDLFIDARRLSDQVYLAMVARGFSGEPKIIEGHKLNQTSILSTAAAITLAIMLVAVDRLAGI